MLADDKLTLLWINHVKTIPNVQILLQATFPIL